MLDHLRVAVVAIDTKPGELVNNLRKIELGVSRAQAEGAQLVLFPELSLSGFIPNHRLKDHEAWLRCALVETRRYALRLDSPPIHELQAIAARHQVLLSVGMFEDAGNVLHNTQLLVGSEGLLGSWRKMHVPMFEMPFYNGGSAPTVVQTPLGSIGINICFDVFLPDSTRLLAVQNVEIVLMPFAAHPSPGTAEAWANWAAPAIHAPCC